MDIGHLVEGSRNGQADADLLSRRSNNKSNGGYQHDDRKPNSVNGAAKDGAESVGSNESSDGGSPTSPTPSTSAASSNPGGLFHGSHKSSGNRSTGTNNGGGNNSGGALFGKSSSLIFPTGVQPPTGNDTTVELTNTKRNKINILLDQCETIRFPFKKKLMLNSLGLTAADVPVKDLYGTSLGNTLHKLSLAGNRLSSIPPKLVTCLHNLKTLDLSQCELHQLPERWNLPQLKRLNLSHNRLTDFPEEVR